MTDQTEDLELFDDVKADFANKFDLNNRLALVWVTGKHGTRKGENGPYEWYETYTLVLDDPKGAKDWDGMVFDADKQTQRETLVPSVEANGPQLLKNFQFSAGGVVARLKPLVNTEDKPVNFRPQLGRFNTIPNAKKGMAPPFSIAPPTDEDKTIARKHAALTREVMTEVEKAVSAGGLTADEDAFE